MISWLAFIFGVFSVTQGARILVAPRRFQASYEAGKKGTGIGGGSLVHIIFLGMISFIGGMAAIYFATRVSLEQSGDVAFPVFFLPVSSISGLEGFVFGLIFLGVGSVIFWLGGGLIRGIRGGKREELLEVRRFRSILRAIYGLCLMVIGGFMVLVAVWSLVGMVSGSR